MTSCISFVDIHKDFYRVYVLQLRNFKISFTRIQPSINGSAIIQRVMIAQQISFVYYCLLYNTKGSYILQHKLHFLYSVFWMVAFLLIFPLSLIWFDKSMHVILWVGLTWVTADWCIDLVMLLFYRQISYGLCNEFDLTTGLQLGLDCGKCGDAYYRPII